MDVTHEVSGRPVRMPVQVRDAAAGTATFLADRRAAAALLPEGLVPVPVGPRHTLVTLVMVDYRDNDLGNYHEMAIQLTVTRPGVVATTRTLARALRGSPQTFTVAMPVNQSFTLEAGRQIWGFPKTLDDVAVDIGPDEARAVWKADGRHVLTLHVPVGRARAMPAPPLTAFTVIDGALHQTEFAMQAAHGHVGVKGVRLELGTHPVSTTLAGLGLPRRALATTWMDDLTATFGNPSPV